MNLFGDDFAQKQDNKYTSKIKAPIYEPKNRKPHIKELYNDLKTKQLIRDIEKSNISDDEKIFLIESAKRHTVFNFSKIADYYSHSSNEMQDLMERAALGELFITIPLLSIEQVPTQKGKGGMTDIYMNNGTFVKTFYTIMQRPSCIQVSMMGAYNPRMHHRTNWDNAVPKIINEKYKGIKQQ